MCKELSHMTLFCNLNGGTQFSATESYWLNSLHVHRLFLPIHSKRNEHAYIGQG